MFIGKWNKSVILTYIGLCFSVLGMIFATCNNYRVVMICLMLAGVCDMFDGYVARKCKRTDSEKQFGIELDSLVDTVSFSVFPVVILISLGLTKWYCCIVYMIYLICQVCRLAYFNISLDDENKNVPVKYYSGLPVTASALIFPLFYLLTLVLDTYIFNFVYLGVMLLTASLNILNIKIPKPHGFLYVVLSLLAIFGIFLYVVVV